MSPTELADYLHDLAERAIRLEDEDVLHGAAELVRLANRRSRFDAPEIPAERSET